MEYYFFPIAMKSEAEPLIQKLEKKVQKNLFEYEIFLGEYKNINVLIGISGVGTINMSGLIHIVLLNYKIKFILNYGLAGGYGYSIHKGNLIVITECLNTNSYKTKKERKGNGIKVDNIDYLTFFENENKIIFYKVDVNIVNEIKEKVKENKNILFGKIGSGDMWNQEYDKIMYNYEKLNLLCEDMECAAVYQIADKYKIPFISIKGISNNEILNENFDYSVMNSLINFVENVLVWINNFDK